jgi:hypothetical protein
LTFKSTVLSDSQLRSAGFVEHELVVPLREAEKRRRLWLAPEVADLLAGRLPDSGFPHTQADVDVGRFCKGLIVSASRREKSKADFKWLKGHCEVWVLSFRKPPPGWRVFGRFARKNVFVAFCHYEREDLADNVQYQAAAKALIAEWDKRFPKMEPFKGSRFEDYFGDMVRNDDE